MLFGTREFQRIGSALTDAQHAAEAEPERLLQTLQELFVADLQILIRLRGCHRPYDPDTPFSEGQHGERALFGKALVRHVTMELLRSDVGDDRCLSIVPVRRSDPGLFARRRAGTVRRNYQACSYLHRGIILDGNRDQTSIVVQR